MNLTTDDGVRLHWEVSGTMLIEGGGHVIFSEQPEAVAGALLGFLAEVGAVDAG